MMKNDNTVIFKGKKDGILVLLDKGAEFSQIRESLRKKAFNARKFFGGASASITFQGRELSDEEESLLLSIIARETNLNISFINDGHIERSKQALEKSAKEDNSPALSEQEKMTYYHRGALRSGQSIRYHGSVVVIGDVNPGGEIIAEGSVIVMGMLKGLVHAGCTGDSDCFVAALKMSPTQLRISNIITYIPEDKKGKNKPAPSYAFIQDEQIYIAPLIL